jgi:hypothetical protein
MLTGRPLRLKVDTLAIDARSEKRIAVTVPAGAIIKVIRGPLPDTDMFEVRWNGKVLRMFAQDIQRRGVEI